MKLIIDILKRVYDTTKTMGNVIDADNEIVAEAIINGTPIPDNATNGDVIKAMFPNGTTEKFVTFMRFIDGEHYFNFSEDWWNSLYIRKSERR